MKLSVLVVLFVAQVSPVVADVQVEAKVSGDVAILTAKTDGKTVVWLVPEGLKQPVPADLLKDSKACILQGRGTFKVTALAAVGEKPIYGSVTFTLGGDAPPVPIPPPDPTDELPRRLREAYAAETNAAKRGQLVNLIGIFSAMAEHTEKDMSIKTSQELFDILNKVKAGMLADGILMEVRRIASAEVAACIGTPGPTPFDRAKVAACFRRIVKSLPTPE
jgi:hypothetical protein